MEKTSMLNGLADELLDLAHTLSVRGKQPAKLGPVDISNLAGRAAAARGALIASAEGVLGGSSDIGALKAAIAASEAAHELESCVRALSDLAGALAVGGRFGAVADEVHAILFRIAMQQLASAANLAMSRSSPQWSPPAAATAAASQSSGGATDFNADKGTFEPRVMRNIARYHREHERYYTVSQLELGADLAREANRLKVVADVWLGEAAQLSYGVDFSDPRYQAAGCDDLNPLPAISHIGILFMEGEQEPAEIRGLKAKLRGMGGALIGAGQWLSSKMDAAWGRESALLAPDYIDVAYTRLMAVVNNWRGARGLLLTGRLINMAAGMLDTVDFTPSGVRANRRSAGAKVRMAGWVLDCAAQLSGKSGVELADNDVRWTEYGEFIDRPIT